MRLNKTTGLSVCGMVAGISAGMTSAHALDPRDALLYQSGPISVRPQLGIAERFDDNILYRPSSVAVRDLVTTFSPGLNLELGWRDRRIDLNLDYTLDQNVFLDRSDLNSASHTLALASVVKTSRLSLEGHDRVQLLSDLLGGGTSLGQKVNRTVFADDYRLEYFVSEKSALLAGGRFDATDYASGTPLYDYNSLRGSLGFGHRPFNKVFFFGETYYGQSASSPNFAAPKGPHLEFLGGYLGARGVFSPRLSGSAKAGYEVRQFGGRSSLPGAPVFDISLSYKMSEKRSAALTYARNTGVSVQEAAQSYAMDAATVQLTQQIGAHQRLLATLSGSVVFYDFAGISGRGSRQDQMFRLGVGAQYQLRKWCRAGLNYDFESFASTAQGIIDYQVNRVTLKLLVGY